MKGHQLMTASLFVTLNLEVRSLRNQRKMALPSGFKGAHTKFFTPPTLMQSFRKAVSPEGASSLKKVLSKFLEECFHWRIQGKAEEEGDSPEKNTIPSHLKHWVWSFSLRCTFAYVWQDNGIVRIPN